MKSKVACIARAGVLSTRTKTGENGRGSGCHAFGADPRHARQSTAWPAPKAWLGKTGPEQPCFRGRVSDGVPVGAMLSRPASGESMSDDAPRREIMGSLDG